MIILNKYKSPIEKGIYIGRGSPLGNPYPISESDPRDAVIDRYEIYLRDKVANKDPVILEALNNLNIDSKLICFCAPKRCHGEVIEKIWKELNVKNFKVIIAGSRSIKDINIVRQAYKDSKFNASCIISGKASGVDKLGEILAKELNLPIEEYPADWDNYGKAAGMIRNKLMASKADALIAICHNNSPGTTNMIKIMKDLNKEVYVVNINDNITKEIDMAENTRPQAEFLTLHNFTLFASTPDPSGRKAILEWSSREGCPRITIWTNIKEDAKNKSGNIYAGMNPETFYIFLSVLKKVAMGNPGDKYTIANMSSFRKEDGSVGEKTHVSDTHIGKDSDGIVWISVTAEGRPKLKFEIQISDFHILSKSDGSGFTKAETSQLQAIALHDCLDRAYAPIIAKLREKQAKGAYKPDTVYSNKVKAAPSSDNFLDEDILF
jgi:hypothetical protein